MFSGDADTCSRSSVPKRSDALDAEDEEDLAAGNERAAEAMAKRRRESDARMKEHRAKLEAQMNKNFGSSASDDLDTTWHLIGCGFFVVCVGILFVVFGKKRDKGRRDL